jgi:hypothetical protein
VPARDDKARSPQLLGEKVAGSVKVQLGIPDYSSFLLHAQPSAQNPRHQCHRRQRHRDQAGRGIRARSPGREDVPMSFQNVDIEAIG